MSWKTEQKTFCVKTYIEARSIKTVRAKISWAILFQLFSKQIDYLQMGKEV